RPLRLMSACSNWKGISPCNTVVTGSADASLRPCIRSDHGAWSPSALHHMPVSRGFDCLVVGYNDPPFPDYERLIRTFGEDSEAYRDLHFSFVDVGGQPLSYVDLLNHVD